MVVCRARTAYLQISSQQSEDLVSYLFLELLFFLSPDLDCQGGSHVLLQKRYTETETCNS